MGAKSSNEGHCSSEQGREIVFASSPDGKNQRVVRLCMNLETPGECHFIVTGVRKECLDALNLDECDNERERGVEEGNIDVSFLRGAPADFLKNAKIIFYNQDCPMYRGADRRIPVRLVEFEVLGESLDDLKTLLRTIVEKARNVFAANSGVSDVVVDAVFPRKA